MLNRGLKNNKVVKNAGWIIGGRVFNKLLALVVGALTARYLGPSNYRGVPISVPLGRWGLQI